MTFSLSSNAFPNRGEIPKKFTCDGEDLSPALSWTEPPDKAQSFALIADDPDAPVGTFTHWILFDLPAETRQLPQGAGSSEEVGGGGRHGRNDFGRVRYGGPCPPPGKPHRYFFKLYALAAQLNLKPGASRKEVEQAMKGHVLAQAEWMGKYKR